MHGWGSRSTNGNENKMQRLWRYPWYTLLLAVYSPLALLAYNAGQVPNSAVLRSLVVIVAGVLVLTTLVLFSIKDVHKAGLIVTVMLILFFSYGHVYELLAGTRMAGITIGRHRYLLLVYLLVLVVTIFGVMRSKNSFQQWSSVLMTIAVVSLIFPVYTLVTYELKAGPPAASSAQALSVKTSSRENLPDIYYIILDTYGRTDWLKEYAGYDNSSFIAALQNLGFYVAECSQSNYAHTGLSLASSLNFDYLDELGVDFSASDSKREDLLAPYIKHNAVTDRLRSMGYKIVAFETGYDFTTLDDTDILYPTAKSGLTDFEIVLLRSTALVYLDDAGAFKGMVATPLENKRKTILSQLETLRDLTSVSDPKFVFAHLLIPHFPYVFDENGNSLIGTNLTESEGNLTTREYFQGYRGQVTFTSDQLLSIVREILQESDPDPIIIIQGDHGPSHAGEAARMGILNAYYFPENQNALLYPDITPVNSFRALFNTYFGTQLDMLPDISYFSSKNTPDEATVIPNECGSKK